MPETLRDFSSVKTTAMVINGSGFIGSYLCEALMSMDCQVICLEKSATKNLKNLEPLLEKKGFYSTENETDIEAISTINYIFYFPEDVAGLNQYEELKSAMNISAKKNSRLLVCYPFHNIYNSADYEIQEYINNQKQDFRIVYIGDVFGQRMSDSLKGLQKYFAQIINEKQITISEEENRYIHPIFIKDIITGLLRSMLVPGTAGEQLYLLPEKKMFLSDFANLVKNNYQEITQENILEPVLDNQEILLNYENDKSGYNMPLGWRQEYPIEEGIKETLRWYLSRAVVPATATLAKEPKTNPKRNPILYAGILLLVIMFFIVLRLGGQIFSLGMMVKEQDMAGLERQSVNVEQSLKYSEILVNIGSRLIWGNPENSISFVKYLSGTVGSLVRLGEQSEELSSLVFGQKIGSLENTVGAIQTENDLAIEQMSLASATINTFSGREKVIGPYIADIKKKINFGKKNLILYRDFLKIVPDLLGANGGKVYLLLFQNNMEIRPGGGFIGSYGLASFQSGKLFHFEVADVYSADGQLKGHVEPPPELKEKLGIGNWYLRDSNWSPDYLVNAARAKWFFEKETGKKVDGVVAVNLFVIQKIISVFGEITIPDYDKTITADNFFETAEYYTEANFFPGSSQKKDFLGSVARYLFEKIKTADMTTKVKIAQTLLVSLDKKDILTNFDTPEVMNFFVKNNWDGRIKDAPDYLMTNEANVGVNKANYYLKKTVNQQINIQEDGSVDEALVLDYQNNSPSNIFPAGDYKTYLRVLTAAGSKLVSCQIISSLRDDNCEIKESEEFNKKIYGIYVVVPVKESRQVRLLYQQSNEKKFIDGDYSILIQKQSGDSDYNYQLSLFYPKLMTVVGSNLPILTGQGKIVYNTLLSEDKALTITFTKKQ